jgi:hypothetical protein
MPSNDRTGTIPAPETFLFDSGTTFLMTKIDLGCADCRESCECGLLKRSYYNDFVLSTLSLSECVCICVQVLASAVSNTHPKVRADAVLALKKIGEVIKNPEILAVAPTLLDSLSEPDKTSTVSILHNMINTYVAHCNRNILVRTLPVQARYFSRSLLNP